MGRVNNVADGYLHQAPNSKAPKDFSTSEVILKSLEVSQGRRPPPLPEFVKAIKLMYELALGRHLSGVAYATFDTCVICEAVEPFRGSIATLTFQFGQDVCLCVTLSLWSLTRVRAQSSHGTRAGRQATVSFMHKRPGASQDLRRPSCHFRALVPWLVFCART